MGAGGTAVAGLGGGGDSADHAVSARRGDGGALAGSNGEAFVFEISSAGAAVAALGATSGALAVGAIGVLARGGSCACVASRSGRTHVRGLMVLASQRRTYGYRTHDRQDDDR